MTTENLPLKPDNISVAWLNTVLASQDATDASILSFDTEVIGEGVGFLSDIVRLSLYWDHPTGCPQSIIIKFATSNLDLRALVGSYKVYENEVHFYQELDAITPIKTPMCYLAHNAPDTQDTLLILQDLSANAMIDQIKGCPLDKAKLVVDTLATLHAFWWENPQLETLSWILRLTDPLFTDSVPEHYCNSTLVAVERLGNRVPKWYPEIQKKYANNLVDITRRMYQYPLTLVHGDFRLDNLTFGTENGQPALTVIDWQMIMCGPGMFDLGYFLSQSLTIKDRRANEKELLGLYYDRLLQQGVQNISFEQLYESYQLVCLWCLLTPIFRLASFDMDSPREAELTYSIAERAFAAIEDHNALDLLH